MRGAHSSSGSSRGNSGEHTAEADRTAIANWLQSHGFTVHGFTPGGMAVDFSGTAAQVSEAFRTEIHYFNVNGARHIANMTDPSVPEALSPAVLGVVSLHDFKPHPLRRPRSEYTFKTSGGTYQVVTPGDLAAIYDLNPLFSTGITGKGQTISAIEDTDLYTANDWTTFRSTFGLSQYKGGSLTTVHPAPATGSNNCKDPGLVAGDDGEAIIDVEWASAGAPEATILLASCAGTRTTFGGFIALTNQVNSKTPPQIVTISYGQCEAENGTASNAAFSSLYQQAVAEGTSVFVAAGDQGAASCDAGAGGAAHGIGVSGFASTPYNVSVGGTDFADNYLGINGSSWSSTNSATFESAIAYIPEMAWNDTCASSLIAAHLGYTALYGSSGFCITSTASKDGLLQVLAGSGGPSGCATGSPSTSGEVGGTCKGYAKPSRQTGVPGVAADSVRDIPDVSLFAATGVWGHYLVDCWSDTRNGGSSCAGAPSTWDGGGGTSYTSPIFAGFQALVNQANGGAQGNPNYVFYKMAVASGLMCNSSGTIAASCIFHNVTLGDNVVPCAGMVGCYGATPNSGRHGILGLFGFGAQTYDGALSTSSTAFVPAYKAGTGWNFATGLGSVDVYRLVTAWKHY